MTNQEYKAYLQDKLATYKTDSAKKALLTKYKKIAEGYLNDLRRSKSGYLSGKKITGMDIAKTKVEITLYDSLYQEIGLINKKDIPHEID